jgi:hypothetical protein
MKPTALLPTALLLSLTFAAARANDATAVEPAADRGEIEHLLTYLAQSPCRFQRNGEWYEATRAAQHLRRKYEYYSGRSDAPDADEFIREAATRSSISGKPYRVACDGEPTQVSADWFRAELARLRAGSTGQSSRDGAPGSEDPSGLLR